MCLYLKLMHAPSLKFTSCQNLSKFELLGVFCNQLFASLIRKVALFADLSLKIENFGEKFDTKSIIVHTSLRDNFLLLAPKVI